MWDIYGQPHVDSSAMTYVGQPRCYDFFLEHRKCWAKADTEQECLPQRKDYIECIYLAKERRRAKDVVDRATKLREQRQKEEKGRQGQLPGLGLVSAVDIPDEPTDYPDRHFPDDARSRGLGWRGKGKIRSWSSELAKSESNQSKSDQKSDAKPEQSKDNGEQGKAKEDSKDKE